MTEKELQELAEKLKAEHGLEEIHQLEGAGVTVLAKAPGRGAWQLFQDMAHNPKKQSKAHETLTRACVLHPDKEAFDELLEKKPGLVVTFGEKLIELAGATQDVAAKKR